VVTSLSSVILIVFFAILALVLYGRVEKEKSSSSGGGGGGGSGSSSSGSSGLGKMVDIPGKLKLPKEEGGHGLDFVVPDMGADWLQFPEFVIYIIRSLLPPVNLARYIGKDGQKSSSSSN